MKKIIALLLTVCILIGATVSVSAQEEKTLYLSDLRLIYANNEYEAEGILKNTAFADYEILPINLNHGTDKSGVWLAYKTTDNVDDAITDIAVMQMGGGYRDGNYQEMLKESREEYLEMGKLYEEAIKYMMEGYDAGAPLSVSAYRQLNFYLDSDTDTVLGDLFYSEVGADALATMFMEGNIYVMDNVRSLIAMGTSYNEDGEDYLSIVAEKAAEFEADPDAFEYADNYGEYDYLAEIISKTVPIYRDMFKELSAYEEEFDYEDDKMTAEEMKYLEYYALARMFRETDYLGGKTLYDFCLAYDTDAADITELYPLVAALNVGQTALVKLALYYDVVRYSVSDVPEDILEENLKEAEEKYVEEPVDIYTGVDRSVYSGSFALTTEAYRADSYSENGFLKQLFNKDDALIRSIELGVGVAGLGVIIWAATRSYTAHKASSAAMNEIANEEANMYLENWNTDGRPHNWDAIDIDAPYVDDSNVSYSDWLDDLFEANMPDGAYAPDAFEKYTRLRSAWKSGDVVLTRDEQMIFQEVGDKINAAKAEAMKESATQSAGSKAANASVIGGNALTVALYIVGAAAMIFAAVRYYKAIQNIEHPEYDDIPVALVDLIDSETGDRYVKYDAVCEAVANGDGTYNPGDLNAFAAKRWNALYYTKSYEAGAPLLATFEVSHSNNTPKDGYLAVHRFGEKVCYNLNKYNFKQDSTSVYLSVKMSDDQKSAVADVPEIIGTILSGGFYLASAGLGILAGVGATLGIQAVSKKKKASERKAES